MLMQGFPLIRKRIFPNISEYFRIRAGPANSEYSEYIRIFPNMRRVNSDFWGIRGGSPVLWGM